MFAFSDEGVVVDAEFFVESDAPWLAVILESRGGAVNGALPRNPDYTIAMELLLARLATLGSELVDAFVDSSTTAVSRILLVGSSRARCISMAVRTLPSSA
ncbi:hypothetical protein JOD63_002949 [Microbacterium terrae]|uniref:hypothetical protein n=1 Tax=Microbacterium terrae TaxID=69369 RepID=UPI0012ED88CE|nr:hypothetical protein [Microbacterium terrae]MBP1078981.1 hypothetical protein [Microbacterium terrae]GLJ98381.1 hypothetical protein GCM10017594_15780 [Microbacterium terrae]